MALTQITTNGIKDGTITGTDLATNIDLVDNQKLRLGTGGDLEIYHNGSHSYIQDTGTGGLVLATSQLIVNNAASNEVQIIATENGSVDLYYNNSKKFETTNAGITLNGSAHLVNSGNFYPNSDGSLQLGLSNRKWSTINGVALNINGGDAQFRGTTPGTTDMTWDQSENALNFADNVYAYFGTGDDLKIYHDGSHSYIDNVTGNLNIRGANNENAILYTANGSIQLFHDNSKKFETTSTGVYITGSAELSNTLTIGTELNLTGGSAATRYIDAFVGEAGTFAIRGTNNADSSGHQVMLEMRRNAGVHLNYSGSTKFETVTGGATITGVCTATSFAGDGSNLTGISSVGGSTGVSFNDNVAITLGTGNDTFIRHIAGSHTEIDHVGSGDLVLETVNGGDDILLDSNDDIFLHHAGESMIVCRSDAQVELYYDNSKKLETASYGAVVTGTFQATGNIEVFDNGKLNIGTGADLQIYHDGTNNQLLATNGPIHMYTGSAIELRKGYDGNYETMLKAVPNGAVELYYDNTKRFETTSVGVKVLNNSDIRIENGSWSGNYAGKIQHHNNYLYIQGGTNGFIFMDDAGTGTVFIDNNGHLRPGINNTYDLGTTSYRWRNIYTNDLNLSNEGGANDVDGTWGSYTIQEGAEDLFLVNKRSGKKYKFNLTEVN
nr:endosialidase [uncultured Mediterranean phage uvMED]BAR21530.1 endosialidase [uncultured Mediterranean phage uvMED]BAR38651.1 endosialidase [uncultured Mediterranean phage uvMED]